MREPHKFLTIAAVLTLTAVAAPVACGGQAPASDDLRTRAWNALTARVQDQKYLRHALAVESILREMAAVAAEDKLIWGLAGLLHDIDLPETSADLTRHGLVGARRLADLHLPDSIVRAVKSHDDRSGVPRTSKLDKALYCADQGYWLVMAAGFKPSSGPEAEDARAVWERAHALPAKQNVIEKLGTECSGLGWSPQNVVELSIKGMRNAR